MIFWWEIQSGDDWGNGPVIEAKESYTSAEAAFEDAIDALKESEYNDAEHTGIYIYSYDGRNTTLWTWNPATPRTLYGGDSNTPDIDLGMMPMGRVT